MLLIRVHLPDRPGALGALATQMGAVGADINALEIVERGPGYAIDDVMCTLPPDVLPDTLVSACTGLPGVKVLWFSRHLANWSVTSDIDVLNRMVSDPAGAGRILTEAAPVLFHSAWAMLVDPTPRVVCGTALAPTPGRTGLAAIGDLGRLRTGVLPDAWLPGWGETVIAVAPLPDGRAVVLARQGGPEFLDAEVVRLGHLADLAGKAAH